MRVFAHLYLASYISICVYVCVCVCVRVCARVCVCTRVHVHVHVHVHLGVYIYIRAARGPNGKGTLTSSHPRTTPIKDRKQNKPAAAPEDQPSGRGQTLGLTQLHETDARHAGPSRHPTHELVPTSPSTLLSSATAPPRPPPLPSPRLPASKPSTNHPPSTLYQVDPSCAPPRHSVPPILPIRHRALGAIIGMRGGITPMYRRVGVGSALCVRGLGVLPSARSPCHYRGVVGHRNGLRHRGRNSTPPLQLPLTRSHMRIQRGCSLEFRNRHRSCSLTSTPRWIHQPKPLGCEQISYISLMAAGVHRQRRRRPT